MKKTLRDSHGFSLVELIIVIAIMAVLVGLLAPQYLKYVEKAKIQKVLTNTQSVANAITVLVTDAQIMDNTYQQELEQLIEAANNGNTNVSIDLESNTNIATFIRNEIDDSISGIVTFKKNSDGYISFTYTMKDGFYEVDYRADLRENATLVKSDGPYNVYISE